MPITEARVETDRPSRYLVQLCKHLSNKGRHLGHRPRSHHGGASAAPTDGHRPPGLRPDQIHVEWSDTQGVLTLPWGRCTLHAERDALVLRAEGDDEQGLRRLQELVTTHLDRFGRREGLQVDWQDEQDEQVGHGAGAPAARHQKDSAVARTSSLRRRHLTWAGIAFLALAIIAVHLGLAEAVLSGPRWTDWTIGAVLAVVVVKIAAATALGRHAHRRGRRRTG
ncbi:DUF2218 domain-containing protein [Streptomyces cyaneochromogenes]|uniref:DUF2218 domain-containing protein n=1 Tax=Streptomyces cyaneochromogenes TaxID=2496836 RepID=A0A3S9MIQ7_9ACTN|nr:DUF2218 domain-containing protein [Streptomyces cyaneochromogenes]AZQ39087.1 DUF2218 domain-containing protein [Streptomyces cyaneochromogenes]